MQSSAKLHNIIANVLKMMGIVVVGIYRIQANTKDRYISICIIIKKLVSKIMFKYTYMCELNISI